MVIRRVKNRGSGGRESDEEQPGKVRAIDLHERIGARRLVNVLGARQRGIVELTFVVRLYHS